MRVNINGGGAWGRSLAFAFAHKSEVSIVSRRDLSSFIDSVKTPFPITQVAPSVGQALAMQVVAISSNALHEFLSKAAFSKEARFLFASKGIEAKTGHFVSEIASEFISLDAMGFLAGPSFAKEVLESLPCALCVHARDEGLASEFIELLPYFIRGYYSSDIIGGEIAGAYKNIIAIGAGICEGLRLGNNAKASYIARGLVEECRFGVYFGARDDTFLGLSGAGDLFLTCNSKLSRNYTVGLKLAENKGIDEINKEMSEVAEGVKTTKAVALIASKENIYVPIALMINDILNGKISVKDALIKLMQG